jgi:hypothetical protein
MTRRCHGVLLSLAANIGDVLRDDHIDRVGLRSIRHCASQVFDDAAQLFGVGREELG